MRVSLSQPYQTMLLLLAIGLTESPSIAEPEHHRRLDKDRLLGDFGPGPSNGKQGGVIHSKSGPVQIWPMVHGKKVIPEELTKTNRRMWVDFGPYTHQAIPNQGIPNQGIPSQGIPSAKVPIRKLPGPAQERKSATDIHHLKKTKDARWLFNSIADEKLFLLLPREKVKKLLGVPRKDTGGLIEYNCRVKDSPGYLELFIGEEQVQSSKIWLEDTYGQSKRKK